MKVILSAYLDKWHRHHGGYARFATLAEKVMKLSLQTAERRNALWGLAEEFEVSERTARRWVDDFGGRG